VVIATGVEAEAIVIGAVAEGIVIGAVAEGIVTGAVEAEIVIGVVEAATGVEAILKVRALRQMQVATNPHGKNLTHTNKDSNKALTRTSTHGSKSQNNKRKLHGPKDKTNCSVTFSRDKKCPNKNGTLKTTFTPSTDPTFTLG
jgi:hypothetical protein